MREFQEGICNRPPPLARIDQVTTADLEPAGDHEFVIRQSEPIPGEFVLVSPDMAACDNCLRDISDPGNRRFGYPFTNCTNCGPRYTIIRDIPYDRPATTMSVFPLCADCESEYHDPGDRRFHAQPNACPVCGPTVVLARSNSFFPANGAYGFGALSRSVMDDVRLRLHQGEIVAVKSLGGFQLACNAENDIAVQQLRRRKKRSDKPFALMVQDIAAAERICLVSEGDKKLLLSPQRPIPEMVGVRYRRMIGRRAGESCNTR